MWQTRPKWSRGLTASPPQPEADLPDEVVPLRDDLIKRRKMPAWITLIKSSFKVLAGAENKYRGEELSPLPQCLT